MKAWIMKTAWPMTTPLPYSPFHICFALFGTLLALWAARTLARGLDPAVRRGVSGSCVRGAGREAAYTVLFTCGALAEPSGLLHPYWTLTLHGFFWHIVLIFIGLFIGFSGLSDLSPSGFVKTIPIFGICCLIASVINVCAPPRGQADMFYISPYYPSNQILYHEISLKTGIFAGNLIYLLSVCLGGLIFHLLFSQAMKKRRAEAD